MTWASTLLALHVAALLAWAFVFTALLPSLVRASGPRARYYDVLWSLLAGVAVMVFGHNLRWLLGIDTLAIRIGLHLFSVLLAAAVLVAAKIYQGAHHG